MNFIKNMGTADRILRVLAAILLFFLYFTHTVDGTLGIALIVLSLILLLTSLFSFCPLYLPFNVFTNRKKK